MYIQNNDLKKPEFNIHKIISLLDRINRGKS